MNSIKCLIEYLNQWNRSTFGNVFHRKKKLMARLGGIERALEISLNDFLVNLQENLTKEYQDTLKQKEDLLVMESSVNWVIQSERNTRFFHLITLKRQSYNRIDGLENTNGD